MEFSIATLLSYLNDEKSITAKILKEKLGFDDDQGDAERLDIALDALEKIGLLLKDKGKYRLSKEENFVEAKLRCSSKGFCFAIQDIEDADDIYIRESHLSHAWNGDRALVKIIKEGSRRRSPEGEVMVILERANPSLLAQVKSVSGQYRAVPLDDRLLFELELKQNNQDLEQAVDHLVHVSVVRYPIAQYLPLGEVTRILGSDAEAAADTDIVCCKHDLSLDFPENILKFVQQLPSRIENYESWKGFRDMSSLLSLTIEDEDSAFIENALTIERSENGNWQVIVHITNVAQYVPSNSALDRTARRRGTTVYLQDKISPLLPEEITKRCSLSLGQDRQVISVAMEFNPAGELEDYEIFPALIQVKQGLTYQQVQQSLAQLEDTEKDELSQKLEYLFYNLSPVLKARRMERGSFEIESESECKYKDEGRLGVILASSAVPVRSMLSEVMLLVGEIVGHHLQSLDLPIVYCGQTEPDASELEDLIKLGQNLDLQVTLESEEEITSQKYQDISRIFAASPRSARVLNYLLECTLKPIKYSSHPINHFGLAHTAAYTHCLAPGRRYGDLFIQRVLNALFENGKDRHSGRSKTGVNLGSSSCFDQIKWKVLSSNIQEELEEQLHTLINHLNEREKLSEDAERDLKGLKKAEQMKAMTGQVFRGLITGVQSYGFFVELADLLVEGLVHVSSLKDDWYEYRARHSCLVGRKNKIFYRLGSEVEVQVKSVDYYRQQIDLVTVSVVGAEDEQTPEET
jgi:ribonuclease R